MMIDWSTNTFAQSAAMEEVGCAVGAEREGEKEEY
jgi:hypothetical protein